MGELPGPFAGRIIGVALALLAMAVAVRIGWAVIEPVMPGLVTLGGLVVVYHFLVGRGGHK